MDKEIILKDLIGILREMTSNWDRGFVGDIGPNTRLIADLGMESIQVVHLVLAVEKHFQRQGLPFQKLFLSEGGDVTRLTVTDLAEFLHPYLKG